MTDHPKDHDAQLAAIYAARPVATSPMQASAGRDHSNSYSKATVRDGEVVATETGNQSRATSNDASMRANAAASVPYLRAEHPQNRCAVSPDQITDDTILHFPQGSVTARDARALGWYSSPNMLTQARADRAREEAMDTPFTESEPKKPEVHPDLDAKAFADPAVEQSLTALVDNTGGFEQMQAIQQIVETGEVDSRTLGTLADQLRTEPGKLQEQLAPIMQAFETQARAVMSEGGLDSNDVVAWAQEHQRDKLNLAMNKQATQRNTAGYAALRNDYLASLGEHRPEMALAANLGEGVTSFKDEKGRVMVRMPKGETMLWRSAIQAFGPKS